MYKMLNSKKIAILILFFIFNKNCFAAGELIFNDKPLTLKLNDNNQARVSSCSDFIALRNAGETVIDLLDTPYPDYDMAKAALFDCYINAYTIKHGLIETEAPPLSLEAVLHHFPASEKLIASDYEKNNIKTKYKGKSIWDTSPDLIKNDDTYISNKTDSGYRIISSASYRTKDNKELKVITLAAFTLHGTFGYRNNYIITSTKSPIWEISKIDENSPL